MVCRSTAARTSTRSAACSTNASPASASSPAARVSRRPGRTSRRSRRGPASAARPARAIDRVISRAMAKEPEERYPTCAALISAAETALGFRKARRFGRARPLLLGAAMLVAVVAAVVVAAVLATGITARRRPALRRREHARPHRSRDRQGQRRHPRRRVAGCERGRRAQRLGLQPRRFDDLRDRRRHEPRPEDDAGLGPARRVLRQLRGAGPGRRRVGRVVRRRDPGRPLLTHLFAGGREARVSSRPHAFGGCGGSERRLGRRTRRARLPAAPHRSCHRPCDRARAFPASSPIDSVAVGFGSVWVVGSADATLYRIDPADAEPLEGGGRKSAGHAAAADELRGRPRQRRVHDQVGVGRHRWIRRR